MTNNNPSLSTLTMSDELANFEKKSKQFMHVDCVALSHKDLAVHISRCKRFLQNLESMFIDQKNYLVITSSKAYDLFAQYCEELIEYANFDKSDLRLIRCAKDLENQLERVFLNR